jgi:amino acid adenylation domain-containing protein
MSDVRHTPVDFDPFAEVDASFALTEPQREMSAAALMGDEANASYNQAFLIALDGPLSIESMRNALAAVVRRHEALRVAIDLENESQRVLDDVAIELPLTDLSASSETERAAAIARIAEREMRTPFDLAKAPLWRAQVVRESPARHHLAFTAHHVIVDGWSSAVIFGDLAKAYAADRFGMPPALPPAASFREFAESQDNPAIVAERDGALEFWAAQYASGAPTFELPLDRPRAALKTWNAARKTLAIDATLYKSVRTVAAREGATLFVALLAAFEVLVARLASADDIVIGVPFAGQSLEDNGHLVAHGVNTLPLRVRIDSKQTFAEHLRAARRGFLDAQAHPRLTFGTLVQKLRLPRDPSRTPLVPIIFNIDKLGSPFEFGELAIAGIDAPKAYFNFELGINAIDNGESILLECDYNADLFDASTITRWLSHYREMLKGIVANPQTPLAELPLLTPEERAQILVDWNATGLRIDGAMRLDRLVEAQAARTPDAEAIVSATERCTYRELNMRANRLARRLHDLGIGRDSLVGVCLPRTIDLVVSLLAVLKAGGAYVPLDPNYPADRIAFMLQDSAARVLITGSELTGSLPASDARMLLVDRDADIARASAENPERENSPHDLAYIIYTSGSTGVPKGVAIEHFSAATLVHWAATVFPPETLRGVLASTSVCFDLSIFELFFTLSRGGRVILADNALHLLEHPARDEVTLINTVPSVIAELLRAGGLPSSIATVCLAGEPLSTRLVNQIYATGHVKRIYDLYGPSEDTTYSTYTLRERDAPATIGRPIANTRAYVLDASMNPVPIGVPGQLFLGGDGLARGYLNRPELTAERFVPDPFVDGARVYRTGDLVRWRPTGEIEYLGRLDHQIKLRGYRIELGEIEAAIARHAGVRDVAVIVREDVPGDRKLVAYVAADAEPGDALRDALRKRLPEYMIPSAIVRLDALPLTPNGKLDRNALPAPEQSAAVSRETVAPRSANEALVVGVFEDVLRRAGIGIFDNFFDLGGHSLMAARVMAKLRDKARVDLPLRNLFERPTPAELAAAIDALAFAAAGPVPSASAEGEREEIEL